MYATTTISAGQSPRHVWKSVRLAGMEPLQERILHESELKVIADGIVASADFGVVHTLIDRIPGSGAAYDWNVGSILQHLDQELLISTLRLLDDLRLYESVGLSYALGTFKTRKEPFAVDFLRNVMERANDSEAWWMAAFALQKLGEGDAVGIMKASLISRGLHNFADHLDRLHDKRATVGVLLTCRTEAQRGRLKKRLAEELLHGTDRATTINCAWLVGRLRCADAAMKTRLKQLMRSQDHETHYHASLAAQWNAAADDLPFFASAVVDNDPLVRKMAVRGLLVIGGAALPVLERALVDEREGYVLAEMTRAITALRTPSEQDRIRATLLAQLPEVGSAVGANDGAAPTSVHAAMRKALDPSCVCLGYVASVVGCDAAQVAVPSVISDEDDPEKRDADRKAIVHFKGPLRHLDAASTSIASTIGSADDGAARFVVDWNVGARDAFLELAERHGFRAAQKDTAAPAASKDLLVPLRFASLTESVEVIGALFGKDAAQEVLDARQVEWEIAVRVTRLDARAS